VAKEKDPEELLAQALRAQAAHAPGQAVSPGFGLISGSDHGLAQRFETMAEESVDWEPEPARRRLGGGTILLLALVLGLASGAVVGLITVL
jgi:hypothetical protein